MLQNKQIILEPVSVLPGVGKQIAHYLERLNIQNVLDLLFHLPASYQDRTKLSSIRELLPNKDAVIEGLITQVILPKRGKGKTKLLCELSDASGAIRVRFFHTYRYQQAVLKQGQRIRCIGQPKLVKTGLEIIHPEIQVITSSGLLERYLTPFYPSTEGVSQHLLRKLIAHALSWLEKKTFLEELLPDVLLKKLSLPTLKEALYFIHKPSCDSDINELNEYKSKCHERLIFEELLAHRLSLLNTKQLLRLQKSVALDIKSSEIKNFIDNLSFVLTNAQQLVIREIQQDLSKPHPMLRLMQGDVGSGKTIVAVIAILQAVLNGHQAALMVPTELLAEQHYRVLKKLLDDQGINIALLTNAIKLRERTQILAGIKSNFVHVVIGTHALFQNKVDFARLVLLVIDEQHRFGVEQRALLKQKGIYADCYPHQLILSATPIPRTLAMSFYADLDCSVINELPPGRTPIVTSILSDFRRNEVIARLREGCKQGKQAYWVCPLINESEVLNCQAASNTALILKEALSEYTIGLIHGRMSSKDKEQAMLEFQRGNTQILVATTVIEVGVDVPNASIIVIENAERLGLSQLHQLRGRVGRGALASHCVLLYQHPLSELARRRLQMIRESTDGFKIAQCDLELRGPGEVFGTKQTGALSFRIANLLRDSKLLPQIMHAADLILQQHPNFIKPLMERWICKDNDFSKV